MRGLVDRCVREFGGVDVLVAAAGVDVTEAATPDDVTPVRRPRVRARDLQLYIHLPADGLDRAGGIATVETLGVVTVDPAVALADVVALEETNSHQPGTLLTPGVACGSTHGENKGGANES